MRRFIRRLCSAIRVKLPGGGMSNVEVVTGRWRAIVKRWKMCARASWNIDIRNMYAKEMKWISKKILQKGGKVWVWKYYHISSAHSLQRPGPFIHNHVKALFMIHLISRDFHEIEHGKSSHEAGRRMKKRKNSSKAVFLFTSSQVKAVANFVPRSMLMTLSPQAPFDVSIRRRSIPNMPVRSQRAKHNILELSSFFLCLRKVKPNKSIFNYLLLREINSTTRRQKRKK